MIFASIQPFGEIVGFLSRDAEWWSTASSWDALDTKLAHKKRTPRTKASMEMVLATCKEKIVIDAPTG